MIVYKCGTEITTKSGKISAIITCCSIRFDKTIYEISYFAGGDYKNVWLNEEEFILTSVANKQRISYKQ